MNDAPTTTLVCAFIDGPLQGRLIAADLEKHDHTDRKTGAYYVRETVTRGGVLVSYFRLRAPVLTKGAGLTPQASMSLAVRSQPEQ